MTRPSGERVGRVETTASWQYKIYGCRQSNRYVPLPSHASRMHHFSARGHARKSAQVRLTSEAAALWTVYSGRTIVQALQSAPGT